MRQKHSVLIIAGEASGDSHGAELVEALKAQNQDISFFGIGGDKMKAAGVGLSRHASEMAFLGFFEVIKHLPFILRVFREMKDLLVHRKPDLVLLVDYPGFNLRFAKIARKHSVPVFYYISPQIWAWNAKRINSIRRYVNHMMVIFPFEEELYRNAGVPVTFVGHPLKDSFSISETRKTLYKTLGLDSEKVTLGLLPGSRKQEVRSLLPQMVEAYRSLKKSHPELQCLIGQSPTLDISVYESLKGDLPVIAGKTHEIMAHSDAVLVASGTATLETAVAETPMVVTYKMAPISYLIGKRLVRVDHVGLVNIVAGKRLVPELIQDEANADNMASRVEPFLYDEDKQAEVRKGLQKVSESLGSTGASERAAEVVLHFLSRQSSEDKTK